MVPEDSETFLSGLSPPASTTIFIGAPFPNKNTLEGTPSSSSGDILVYFIDYNITGRKSQPKPALSLPQKAPDSKASCGKNHGSTFSL
ncbi:MAG: hypothetical protein ACLR1T_09340 [Evtepia gabavorous]